MTGTPLRSIVFALGLGLFAACEQPAASTGAADPGAIPSGGTVIAKVDGQPVTQEMVDFTLEQLPPQYKAQLEQMGQMGQLKEQVMIGEILYRKAIAEGLHKNADTQLALAMSARNALADAMLNKVVDDRATPERIQKWYDDHLVQFAQPQVNARILVVSADKAEEVKAKLDGGADFVATVGEYSEDPRTKTDGGELGWVDKKGMPPTFFDPMFAAEKGAVVGPLEAGDKQLFFKVEDKRDKTPLSEVEDQVKDQLKGELIEAYVKEVKDAATIEEMGAGAAPADAAKPDDHDKGDGHNH